ncbi:MAG TPA: hypothetical protein VGS79_02960 [Puia sp.]|nr:hypothetical protein [Puia sp.]
MNRTILAGTLALLSVAFFSCSDGGNKNATDTTAAGTTAKTAIALDSAALNFPHGGGQPVPMANIQPCLDAYAKVMASYGISADSPSVPITKCPPMTYRITTTEGLTYASFRSWLDSVVAVIDPVGKGSNVWLKIQPGICTQQFVTAMGANASRTGRISYFIVPALIDSSKAQSNNPGGGNGFEIGGLQP